MKMMLESGAKFGSMSEEGLPPEIENQFLKNIMAFEKQAQEMKMIKIFDKIETPIISNQLVKYLMMILTTHGKH